VDVRVRVGGAVDVFSNVALEEFGVKERAFGAESGSDIAEDTDEENGTVAGNWLV
jgi:hypothetical protein